MNVMYVDSYTLRSTANLPPYSMLFVRVYVLGKSVTHSVYNYYES